MAGPRPCNIHGMQKVEWVTKKVLQYFKEEKPLEINKYTIKVESFILTFYSDKETALEMGNIHDGIVDCVHSLEYFRDNDPFEYVCKKCFHDYIQ